MSAGAPLDARVRLGVAVAAWTVALATSRPATAASVGSLALALRLARPRPLPALLPPLAIGLLAAGVAAALGPGTARATAAGALLARVLAAGWIGAALLAFLPLEGLLGALRWARVPPALLEIVAVADRQRHALAEHVVRVRDAQRLRLGWRGPARSLRSAGALAGLAAWRAVAQAEVVSDALALRGARGTLPRPVASRPGWPDALFAAAAALALCACVLLPRVFST